jgi:hypothetical protein
MGVQQIGIKPFGFKKPRIGASSSSWKSYWKSRNTIITIDNSSGGALTNYQVKITLTTANFDYSRCNANGYDIRFMDTGGVGINDFLNYWIETWNTSGDSIIWVKIPSIAANSIKVINLWYGNSQITSAYSDGGNTFEFFDSFDFNNSFLKLGTEVQVLSASEAWETGDTHTACVVEANLDGYKYWMYYCGTQNEGIGLARSNSLTDGWIKYADNPIMASTRWPNCIYENGVFTLFYDMDYADAGADFYIVKRTSVDGINFSDEVTVVAAQAGYYNNGSSIFKNPNDGKYYLYWNRGNYPVKTTREIWVKVADTIDGLAAATAIEVFNNVDFGHLYFAAPSVQFINGEYWMLIESSEGWVYGADWATNALKSNNPISGFQLTDEVWIMQDGRACAKMFLFNGLLYIYFSYKNGANWDTRVVTSDLTYNTGSPLVNWKTTLTGNATVALSTVEKRSGVNSVKLYSGETGTAKIASMSKVFNDNRHSIKCWVYITSLTISGTTLMMEEIRLALTRVLAVSATIITSPSWRYYVNGGWVNSTIAVTTGWHEVEIIFLSTGTTIKIDGVALCTNSAPAVTWDEILFYANESNAANKYTTYYLDDFIKRQCAEPEPTIALT